LDTYSGAAAAYSLRRLITVYTGSLIRVRRSSDNTEQNIGFDSDGNLDTVALSAFVGSGSGFVTTWYDQSGNSRNVTQTTAANQPRIVNAGALELLNNKVCVSNYGQNQWLQLNSFGSNIASVFSFAMVGSFGNDTFRVALKFNPPSSGNNTKLQVNGFTSLTSLEMQGSTSIYYAYPSVMNTTIPHIVQGTFNSASSELSVNNQTVVTGNAGGSTLNGIIIGADWAGSYPTSGKYQEVVVWGVSKSSNRSVINTALNSYYSTYPNPTSVWNLLAAAYNADTKSLPSLKTSLVAAYNGESNTNDSFGTNNGTAVGGLTYTSGKIGTAFTFNGTNAYVSLPDNSLNLTGPYSISMWAYFASNPSSETPYLLHSWNGTTNTGFEYRIRLGKPEIGFFTSGGLYTYWYAGNGDITSAGWYNLTLVKPLNQQPQLYLNGVSTLTSKRISNGTVTEVTYTSPVKCSIGNNITSLANYMPNGSKIDALNVWNKELTASEVSELYNSGNGAQYIGDNFYKPTTNDALGTNNGTAQGGLTYGVGKVGTAFQFNGTNAYVRYPAGSMNFTSDFSISVWVNIPAGYIGTNEIDLLTNITMPFWYNNPKGFWFRLYGGSVYFGLETGTSGVNLVWNDTTGSLIKGNSGWLNIVATRKESTRSNLYVNGILKASNTSTLNPVYSLTNQTPASGSLYIVNSSGVVQNNSVFAPNGTKIDEVNVWTKELTQSEITELYNSGNGKQYPN
jgi:hypothetical protein